MFVGDFGLAGRLKSSRAGPGLPAAEKLFSIPDSVPHIEGKWVTNPKDIHDLRLNSRPDVGEDGSCVMDSSPPSKPKDSIKSIAVPPPRGDSN